MTPILYEKDLFGDFYFMNELGYFERSDYMFKDQDLYNANMSKEREPRLSVNDNLKNYLKRLAKTS